MKINAKTILIVDDQVENLKVMEQVLSTEGYRIVFAKNGKDALDIAQKQQPDLILLDIMMPQMDGYTVCKHLKQAAELKHIPVIFVTTMNDTEDEKQGFEVGAVDYIEKPIQPGIVRARVKTHLSLVQMETLEETQRLIIERLGRAAEYRDNETGLHTIRMSRYSELLARRVGEPEDWCNLLLNAAPMHDVGKIGIPDHIMLKPAALTADEWEIMKTHSQIGADILGEHTSPLLTMARTVALTHHEKWDGSGYPRGLAGKEIPLEGRIVAVADVFDALTTQRPYKSAWPLEQALDYLKEQKGQHFDPELINVFMDNLPDILDIKRRWAEKETETEPEETQ
ncbi:two-component system response regulator [Pleionea sp. CnH1-48]|uniref:response regulator n=1 Tax=Pleionea sp. CnH1-48 TaxID=2954494 RepID=UPI002097DC55|nr:two-component system response regulator [Pleionea sp. CnH1-48]MCO7226902.1 two-component system response regulator [Pleionea sp. CnH1-48]